MFKSIINDQGSITTRFIFNITQCEADSLLKQCSSLFCNAIKYKIAVI